MTGATSKTAGRKKSDALARAFLATLATIEGRMKNIREDRTSEISDGDDPVERLVAATDGARKPAFVPVRADLAAVAVLVARAIDAEPGLVVRLRREAPVVTIATHVADLTELAAEVIRRCVFAKGTPFLDVGRDTLSYMAHGSVALIVRDGTNKSHTSDVGNAHVGAILHAHVPFIVIAPDPTKEIPRDLNRAAEAKLVLPPFDAAALSLVIEAVVGAAPTRLPDDALARTIDVGDLPVALRRCRSPDDAQDAVAAVLAEKADYLHSGLPLRDLHGYGAARDWGLALAQDMKMYREGRLAWCDVDSRALLLTGPPGVGKTSFARAVAKECLVPLIATSVAQWHAAEYLSGTLRRIRETFASARSRAPSILFIDEIDGISDRAKLRGEYVQYWSQVVNCFLELLSGIETLEGVIVVAATNYPDLVDSAVKRAGRLDREIEIRKPDTRTLCAIFRQYLGSDIDGDVSLIPLALAAQGHTGADVESWVRRARGAARRAGRRIDIEAVLNEIRAGRPPLPNDVRRRVAIHEAGHVVAHSAFGRVSLVAISLHDCGGEVCFDADLAGDATLERVEGFLAATLAGRAAETIAFGSPSIGAGNGAASDLGRATDLARDLELRFGMGAFGPIRIEPYAGDVLLVDWLREAVSARLREAEERATTVLKARWDAVEAIAAALEERGYLDGSDIAEIMEPASAEVPVGADPSRRVDTIGPVGGSTRTLGGSA